MSRIILPLIAFSLLASSASAQVVGGKFQKLFDLYAVEKYESCLEKAIRLTENENTRKEAEPYLYMSMCFLEIHKNIEEYDAEFYEKALYDAMKYAARFRKKDKTGELYESNTDYFEELTKASLEDANHLYFEDKFRKAASTFRKIHKFIPEDNNILYMVAVCQLRSRNAGEGNRNLGIAITGLKESYASEGFEPNEITEPILVRAIIDHSTFLQENGMRDSAEIIISTGREILKTNEDIKDHYKKIIN